MHAFGPTEDAPSSLDAVQVLESAITVIGELNTQEADTTSTIAEHQGNIDALEEERARDRGTVTATHAEPRQRVAAVRKGRRVRSEELRENLEEPPYELDLVNSSTQVLPHELMAEMFDWHVLMGGRLTTTLLVCKRWSMVAYRSPRLWSRIFITDFPQQLPYLRGTVLCTDLDYLRLVLSRSRSSPLQLELFFRFKPFPSGEWDSSGSLIYGPDVAAKRITAVKLVLGDQILRRCTSLVLGSKFLPLDHLNTTVLPLLSSIHVLSMKIKDHELLFIQSVVNLSPALRHIRCNRGLSAKHQGVGLWTRRIESYSCIGPLDTCGSLHESPSLRRLEVFRDTVIPLALPALQTLKWTIGTYSTFHRITAPHLHTLILRHSPLGSQAERQSANSISFPNLRVAIHTWIFDPTVLYMFHTPALEHLSIEYRSSYASPAAILELFDGWTHMPRPKSLHLDCTFTDSNLVSVLGRLPWLEELKVAGGVVQDPFWQGMALPCDRIWQVPAPDEHATGMLVPNLKVLMVNYPTAMRRMRLLPDQEGEIVHLSYHRDNPSIFGHWKVWQILGVADARKQAGCPLRTLACWFPENGVNVVIGSLDGIPNRPEFVP